MNNSNLIHLQNENGRQIKYGQIPDLWHVMQSIAEGNFNVTNKQHRERIAAEINQVWMMAHDLKAVVEEQGEARIIAIERA